MGCSTVGTSALYEMCSDLSSKNVEQICKVREKSEHCYLFPEKTRDYNVGMRRLGGADKAFAAYAVATFNHNTGLSAEA